MARTLRLTQVPIAKSGKILSKCPVGYLGECHNLHRVVRNQDESLTRRPALSARVKSGGSPVADYSVPR